MDVRDKTFIMPRMSKCFRRRSSLCLQLAVLLLIQLFVIWSVVGSRQSAFFDKLFGVDRQRVNPFAPVTYSDTTIEQVAKKTTKKPPIDMVNDYQPFVDFRLVFPQIIPTIQGSRNFFPIILVNSAAKGI